VHLPRRLLPALAAMGAVALLAGCSTAGPTAPSSSSPAASSPSATTAPATALACPEPGSASDAVKVTGGSADAAPKVTFPTPTSVKTTERTTVEAGTGATVKQGDSVSLAYTMYDARTGKQLDSRGWSKDGRVVFPVDATQVLPGFAESIVCTKPGERVAAVIPSAKAFGDAGSKQIPVKGGDSIVFVAQIVSVTPTKATGAVKDLPAGFPTVTLAGDGKPTVKIPATAAPKKLEIADAKVGTGATVKEGDTVTVQYQGVLWRTGKVFDQSWGRGPTSFATTQVVPGFGKALVGQKVGSQVVAIIPPDQGYGKTGSQDGSIKGTDTMVFVIDVLATARTTGS